MEKMVPNILFYTSLALYAIVLMGYFAVLLFARGDIPSYAIMSSETVILIILLLILLVVSVLLEVLVPAALIRYGMNWKLIVAMILDALPGAFFLLIFLQTRRNVLG